MYINIGILIFNTFKCPLIKNCHGFNTKQNIGLYFKRSLILTEPICLLFN